jgi:hypothetical protein
MERINELTDIMLINDFNLSQIFRLKEDPYYRMEEGKKDDLMFEFQSL